jgi:hypothetical protein
MPVYVLTYRTGLSYGKVFGLIHLAGQSAQQQQILLV